jgi:hypothetical protein
MESGPAQLGNRARNVLGHKFIRNSHYTVAKATVERKSIALQHFKGSLHRCVNYVCAGGCSVGTSYRNDVGPFRGEIRAVNEASWKKFGFTRNSVGEIKPLDPTFSKWHAG